MSAVVTVSFYRGERVEVPGVGYSAIDKEGRLLLSATSWGDVIATFQADKWESVVITPERGPDGRFVKRGNR